MRRKGWDEKTYVRYAHVPIVEVVVTVASTTWVVWMVVGSRTVTVCSRYEEQKELAAADWVL
jgi:hypothetical protein